MEYQIIDEKFLSETEVKEKYLDFVDKNSEFGKKLLDHAQKNIKIDNFNSVFEELSALNLSIRDDYLRMIIDVSPSSVDQIRAIISPLKLNVKEEDLKAILAVLKKHL
jgi:DNA-directed RNA polymerase subunit F